MKKILPSFFFLFFLFTNQAVTAKEDSTRFDKERVNMVETQIKGRGVSDKRTLQVMKQVPRHLFVPKRLIYRAYSDRPLPIGEGQTISQPYIVGLMTEQLKLKGSEKILEIGTGSGYQAAVLSGVAKEVYTIEIKSRLFKKTNHLLKSLNYKNILTKHDDGYFGWEGSAPFDCIMITASVDHVPPPLLKQLKDGGRLILPLGNPFSFQNLVLITKQGGDYTLKQITGVLFVPMTGHALDKAGK